MADSAWWRRVRAVAIGKHALANPLLMLLFIDGTGGGKMGTKQMCPGYVTAANRAGGLAPKGWHLACLFPFVEDPDLQIKDTQCAIPQVCCHPSPFAPVRCAAVAWQMRRGDPA